MIQNYLKIAWRNLQKYKIFSLINIVGLSMGIAACLLITIYIRHEISYDHQVPKANQLYRLVGNLNEGGNLLRYVDFSANMARTLKADFAEVEQAGRLMDNPLFDGAGGNEIRIEGQSMKYHEEGFTYADTSLLEMFDFPMVEGDLKAALSEPNTLVISREISEKYFPNESAMGKSLYLNGNDSLPIRISGVMENLPSNSHLDYDFLLTLTGVEFGAGEQTRWLQNNYFTYLMIREGTDIEALGKKITAGILENYLIPALKAYGDVKANTVANQSWLELQALPDIHLYSTTVLERKTRGDIRFIWLFGAVALFILLIACINFINLSTAQSANRAKEVGLRKVVGSQRSGLVFQFLTESMVITLMAFILGLNLASWLMPLFGTLSGKELSMPWGELWFIPSLLGAALLIGLVAGLYPAFFLSAFEPIHVLKGKLSRGSKSAGLRSGLVIFQFSVSVILIVGTIIINKQMHYMLNKEVGYDKEQVIQLQGTNMLGERVPAFKEELLNMAGIERASVSDYLPIVGTKRNGNTFWNEGQVNNEEGIPGQAWVVDEDYLSTLGMHLVEGRNFSKERASDQNAVIINQKMAEKLRMKNPLEKRLSRFYNLYDIIGVVEDFHFENLREEVTPLAMFYGNSNSVISVKANTEDMTALLAGIEEKWQVFAPDLAFRYTFMDESYAEMYDSVQRIGRIFTSFAILAILVACLGLYALSAFLVEQRRKEMSIRKVLGASMQQIFERLTRHFLSLVGVALVIGFPIAYFLMREWLKDYPYRTDIDWWVFVVAGLIAIVITLSTVSYHAVKTALVNPAETLASE